MTPLRIFISSVQSEFADERGALRDYLRGDPLLRRFFEVFLFEDAPASDRRPDELYLNEVETCDLYVGLFGDDYGTEDEEGVSPTEREFDYATVLGKHQPGLFEAHRWQCPASEDAGADWQGPGSTDPEAIQQRGGTGCRIVRCTRRVP